ncbi:tyrosine-type recombinase/integrase [Gramella lutea]|uniref:Tyrosine-type recombinase/integrase n=1 Tax=Christiangramia lutea TaxID=1607951 RepID=A0A9X1V3S6_9FLAO|nr:tyrosine-type recombinase/integrase [Christiangramia lutea]MCH4823695.1 tyrosine-type recombinase/integrase [Christiangramia lutea]
MNIIFKKIIMTGSTYIEFDKAVSKGFLLIQKQVNPNFGLLIICGCNLGLRISDLLKLNFKDLKKDEFTIVEQKTGKIRTLQSNHHIKLALRYFEDSLSYKRGGKPFVSQKGTTYSIQQVNRLIKKYFSGNRISSHSLRKSFGRRVWEMNNKTDQALLYLSEIFNHSNTLVTRRYLGIRQEEIKDIYLNL